MEQLIQTIGERCRISPDLEQAIRSNFHLEEVKKNHLLLKEDQYARNLYFIEQGTLRTYYLHDGKEITSWFYHENQFLSAWYSFISGSPSFEYIEVLEDATLYRIDRQNYLKLIESFPAFESFVRKLVEDNLAYLDHFSKGYMFMSAKEKYDLILSMFPDIEFRVKLGHIASLLGISQETLSRIRKQKR